MQKPNGSAGILVLVSLPHIFLPVLWDNQWPPPSPPCAGSRDSVGLEAELTQCPKSCLFENESLLLASDKQMLWLHTAM